MLFLFRPKDVHEQRLDAHPNTFSGLIANEARLSIEHRSSNNNLLHFRRRRSAKECMCGWESNGLRILKQPDWSLMMMMMLDAGDGQIGNESTSGIPIWLALFFCSGISDKMRSILHAVAALFMHQTTACTRINVPTILLKVAPST